MKNSESFSMSYDAAKNEPDLLVEIAGIEGKITALTAEIAVTNKGISVIVFGGHGSDVLRHFLGDEFDSWVEEVGRLFSDSAEVNAVLESLQRKLLTAFLKNELEGGAKNG